jgi:hypothetical protein
MRRAAIVASIMGAVLLAPSLGRAQAQFNVPEMKAVSVWGILGWGYYAHTGYGAGARYTIPLVQESLIKGQSFKDRLALEVGGDFLYTSWGVFGVSGSVLTIEPVAGLMWAFWLNDKLALYPKLDFGFAIGITSGALSGGGYSEFDFGGSAGVIYKLDSLALRAELGNLGLKAGVAFGF